MVKATCHHQRFSQVAEDLHVIVSEHIVAWVIQLALTAHIVKRIAEYKTHKIASIFRA